jgi:DNA-binding transcriptional LysR family regulator
MTTLRQLAHAKALADIRNFRLAARAMHISQPALTRSIQALEDALGVPLFDRLPGGAEPTKFGEVFLRKAESILLEHEDLVRDMQLLAGLDKGALCVSAGPYPGSLHVPRVAAVLAAKHPALTCRLRQGGWGEVAAHVLARESDLGIAEISEASRDERLRTEPVGQHSFFLYCRTGHPLLKQPGITLPQITSFPWVGTRVPMRAVSMLGKVAGRAGTVDSTSGAFVPAWEVEVVGTAKRIVAESDLVGGALLTQIEGEIEVGALAVLRYYADWMRLNYGFIYLRNRTVSPAARAFMAEFRRLDAELEAREIALQRRYKVGPAAKRFAARRS